VPVKVADLENTGIPNSNSNITFTDAPTSPSSLVPIPIKAEPEPGDEDVLVLAERPPCSKRRRRNSSVSSSDTLPVRYIINTEKIDHGYDKYEFLDDRDQDTK